MKSKEPFSNRTIISLCQLLGLQEKADIVLLLKKFNFPYNDGFVSYDRGWINRLEESLNLANNEQILNLINEIITTKSVLRSNIQPRYRFDERWQDFKACLELDGYTINDDGELVTIEPKIKGEAPIHDDLTAELEHSSLEHRSDIIQKLKDSADDFKKEPPDYNGCLNNARVALETIAKDIAEILPRENHVDYDHNKWGSVIEYLSKVEFIDTNESTNTKDKPENEEKGLTGVYKFISSGSHRPYGPNEKEIARLGRNFALGMCYLLVKRFNEFNRS